MPADFEPQRPGWPKLTLRRPDQAIAALLLAVGLTLLGGHWTYHHLRRGRLVEIDSVEPAPAPFVIDINEADWPEFCLLPGVGETLAKRIVEYRRLNGPFEDLEALRRVRGIGPKTFNDMQPYLLPLADVEATAGDASPIGQPKG
jgi:competence protein ComEA